MRLVCAEIRELHLDAAAAALEVARVDLRLEDGVFSVPGTDLRTSYWDLKVDLARDFSGKRSFSSGKKVLGKPIQRRDFVAKLFGAAYVHDLELPGMLHARVLRPQRYGARLVSIHSSFGNAQVVRNGDFVAVVAEREEDALRGLEAATAAARWEGGEALPEPQEIAGALRALPSSSSVVHRKDAAVAPVRRFEATYSRPYLAHASIGPSCALASYEAGKLTVWSHTQGPHFLRGQIAKVMGLPEGDVQVVHRDGPGCYGHNGADDVALDAALVSRACGRPVRVLWTREQELAWSPYGSAMVVKVSAGVDATNRIVDWRHELWSHTHIKRPGWGEGVNLLAAWAMDPPHPVPPAKDMPLPAGGGDRNAVPFYDFARQEIVYHFIPSMPLRVSALRALGAHANVFAIESMVDEIARELGADPLEYRLRHLSDPRARAVLEAAAKAAGWKAGRASDGEHGRGIAFARYKNLSAYCAIVMDVRAAETVKLERAFAAVDAGEVVNPDGLVNQVEAGIVQAASWTLKEAVGWNREGVTARSWDDYPIIGFGEVPDISVSLINNQQPFLGAGECAAGPASAAIANALHDAIGLRARHLPLTPERLAREVAL